MKYFGASIQMRKAGQRHQTKSRPNIMAEITITIRLITVLGPPAACHTKSARMQPGSAAPLRRVGSSMAASLCLARHFPRLPRLFPLSASSGENLLEVEQG